MKKISIIDSHTGGEPTRVVLDGGPDLGGGPLAQRAARFSEQFDHFRSAIVCEPRGSDVLVGALLCEPDAPGCSFGVIFFNNVGCLGMCGHGMIGLVATLAHLGRIGPGRHWVDTPAGPVAVELHGDGSVSVHNVEAYRSRAGVEVELEGYGTVVGDVAYGGNWFFLVGDHGQELRLDRVEQLTAFTWKLRCALEAQGVAGDGGALIDHVELFAPGMQGNDSRNFVLCPGKAYDRSPCGTGTSAKVACLAADGKLAPGALWRQESITGSVFEASYSLAGGGEAPPAGAGPRVLPHIRGSAFVTAEAKLLLDERDPLQWGIR